MLLCIKSDRAHLPRTASVSQERSQGHHPLQESADREMKRLCFILMFYIFISCWGGIADVQCCVSFGWTAKWSRFTYTYIHSSSDASSTQVTTDYWAEFPVLFSSSLLIIYFMYSGVSVLTPHSQFAPLPHMSSWAATSLSSKCVSLFLFCKSVFLDPTYK